MQLFVRFRTCKHLPALLLAGTVATGGTVAVLRLKSRLERELPGVLRARIGAAVGRPVEFGKLHLLPTGIWVDRFRVPAQPGESQEPLRATSMGVSLNWWDLLTAQKVRVASVQLDGAVIRFPAGGGDGHGQPWTTQLLSLSRSGIEHFRLQNSSVHLLDRNTDLWSAQGIDGDLSLHPGRFRYQAQVKRFDQPGVQLASLHLTGSGDSQGVTLEDGAALLNQTRIKAHGRLRASDNHVAATVKVHDLPLCKLAKQLGLPEEWAVLGHLTGEVAVDAQHNALRSVRGTVNVERGSVAHSGSRFPWTSATAHLDWSPQRASLNGIRVRGDGIALTADGSVVLGGAFTSGKFDLTGKLQATRTDAVARTAELLSFRQPLGRRWSAKSASVQFHAAGNVGQLGKANADGNLAVEGLEVQAEAHSAPVHVAHMTAQLRRAPDSIEISQLAASSDGLSLTAPRASLLMGATPQVNAAGRLEVRDLRSLRAAVPQSALWKWLTTLSPTASGAVDFQVDGPTSDLRASGQFTAREFRLGLDSPLPNGTTLLIPVREARGSFDNAAGKLALTDLKLNTQGFTAVGQVSISDQFSANLQVHAEDWRNLPAVPPGALADLHGGKLNGTLEVAAPVAHLAEAPVTGAFIIEGSTFGAREVPVRSVSANFRWANRTLELPSLIVDSPAAKVDSHGSIARANGEYHLNLDADLNTPDAGALINNAALTGGAGGGKLHIDGPVQRLADARITGDLDLRDAVLRRAVPALAWKQVEAKRLQVEFTRDRSGWQIARLRADGPQGSLTADGTLDGSHLNASVQATVKHWTASSPLTGGTLEARGTLRGDSAHPEALLFAGKASLEGATASFASKNLALAGGTVSVNARGEGTVSDLRHWLTSGEVRVTDSRLTTGNRSLPVTASAQVKRDGESYHVDDLKLTSGDLNVAGQGDWSEAGHKLTLTASTGDLARLGVRLPAALTAKHYQVTATLHGTSKQPVEAADGRLEVTSAQLRLAGNSDQPLDHLTGAFHYTPAGTRFENLEAAGPAGVLKASGEWTPSGTRLALTLDGTDLSRLAIQLPAGLKAREYHLDAELRGDGTRLVSTGTGMMQLQGAEFSFGPGKPHRLDTASARFALNREVLKLSDLQANGPAGRFTGSGQLVRDVYRLQLASNCANPDLARWLVPGTVTGGALAGTLTLEGDRTHAVSLASGHFDLTRAGYGLPESLGVPGKALAVSDLSGDYEWNRGRLALKSLKLDGDLLDGTGALSFADGAGHVSAELTAQDLGQLTDLWPALRRKLRGGAASAKLDASWNESGLHGTLALQDRGGELFLPEMPAELASNPVQSMNLLVGFAPGKLTFSDAHFRGPRGNADATGSWELNGPVNASGKAWFAKDYSKKLIKAAPMGWLARLLGMREIKSDFTITGDATKLTLDAGITRSHIWKFAKTRVPKEFQAVAAGKAPLWVKPVVVGQLVN